MKGGNYVITPLGAAIVEAMKRDKALEAELQRAFRKQGKCPTSRLFPTKQSVEQFYREHREHRRAMTSLEIVGVESAASAQSAD